MHPKLVKKSPAMMAHAEYLTLRESLRRRRRSRIEILRRHMLAKRRI
jgi:hypothetical protein